MVLRKLFDHKAPKRPSYKDLYSQLNGRRKVNANSFRELLDKFENDENELKKFNVELLPQLVADSPTLTLVTASRAGHIGDRGGKYTHLPAINR